MTTYQVSTTRRIAAPARVTYDIIADYRDGHAQMVPPQWFQNLRVESGGFGAGTTICFDVRAFGSTKSYRARVDEPAPGRVLRESDVDENGAVTTFSVEPTNDGRGCDVTIASELHSRDGILGVIERWMAKPVLRRLQAAELERLEALAKSHATASSSSGPAAA